MASGPLAPLAAGFCLLLSALACARGWKIGIWFAAAGAALLAGGLVARGLAAGRWPLTNEYEFALAFALAIALATIGLGTKAGLSDSVDGASAVQAAALAIATGLVAYARLGMPAFKRTIQPLQPALDSTWLPLHVGSAALGYGALTVAGAAGLVWLVYKPSRTGASRLRNRGIAVGYPLLTLSMIFGMIWAQVAWGRYWGWDLKEVWTLITWLLYTLYWHLRGRPGWQGRRLAWLALAGLGAIFFTFLGVGWLARRVGLQSLHLF
jgi:ABC-type transport system involved in cytochrome c biogenesis permease subunit